MLKRFSEAKSFGFHVPKLIQVPTNIFVEYFGWKIMYVCCVCTMYVLYVCIICMYYMYLLYVCIICMYCMYVLNVCIMYCMYVCIICMYYMCYMYVKLRGQVALRGQKVHGNCNLRIQGRM